MTRPETELFKPVNDYFTSMGFRVDGEVGDCDITAYKDTEFIIIELKNAFNLKLVIQGAIRQRISEFVYLAIPYPEKDYPSKEWKDRIYLLRKLELGLIFVRFKNNNNAVLEFVIHPEDFSTNKSRSRNKKARQSLIKEIKERHKNYNTGGSKGKKIMTAYREKCIMIASSLLIKGPLSPKVLRGLGADKAVTRILYKNYYGWFEKVNRGLYNLSEKGRKELQDYPELAAKYSENPC